ncbi:MAG: amidohydrolase family protein [Gemmatimonadales bacterium]
MTTPRAIPRSLLVVGLAALASFGCQEPVQRVALMGVTVVNGGGGPVQRDMIVLFSGGHIDTIVPADGFKLPKNTTEIDAHNRWVIPGLIDAHAHLERWAIARYLAWGVTSIRDLHGQEDSMAALADEVNLGAIPGPRTFISGPAIDGSPSFLADASAVSTEPEARRMVDQRSLASTAWVATYTRITPALLRAIVDEATRLTLPVASQLGLTDAVTASGIGVRSIELLSGVPEAASPRPDAFIAEHVKSYFDGWNYAERSWATLDSTNLARVASAMVGNRTFLVPTLVLHDTWSRLDDPAVLSNSGLAAVPDSEKTRWDVPGMVEKAGWNLADFAAFRTSRPNQDLFVRVYRADGGVVVAGTGAPSPMIVPGMSLHREMELLVAAGFTPADALAAATANAAMLLQADSLGRLAPGKVADMVVLTQDPLADIRNTRAIDMVISRGHILLPDSIRAAW